ncbi:ovarian cancer G-protein coupled receptor 1-like [Channa argus]|uniref:ovarian cancer G-protein coupled receptor 1-like n=1 Tax=Channa argus TaxID=215402 RepID=UPI0035213631
MGDYDFNSTSQNSSYKGSSSTGFIQNVVRKDNTAPIYVINLLLADLIQLCSMSVLMTHSADIILKTFSYLYFFGLLASVGFMVCISLERYLVISCPLWYRFRRTIKISLMVCIVVWALPLVYVLPVYFLVDLKAEHIFAIFLLLPFPLLIFSLGGKLKALSAASRVPTDEKRRIVAMLVLVLLIYTLLFLPSIIWSLAEKTGENYSFRDLSLIIVQFSPIADSILYVLLRKGAVDKVLASLSCCRMESNDINPSTTIEN